jgi:hypothetical protein
MDPGEVGSDLLHQSSIAGPHLGVEVLGKRKVVSVIASWQSESTGYLQGSQMEGGIGVTPDPEREGYVEGF